MRRRQRLLLAIAVVVACVAAIVGLTQVSQGSEGPLSSIFSRVGSLVGRAEHAARMRARGGARERQLGAFVQQRMDTAWLRQPDAILLGAYDDGLPQSLEGIARLDSVLGHTLPLVQLYTAWGDKPDQTFPVRLAEAVWSLGSVPVITWEPWLSDFESARHPHLPLREARDRHGLAAVAAGAYDFYVDAWARDAAAFGRPLYLRFAHEMNDPYRYPWGPQNNSKEEFIAAWRHVVDRFRAAGATNVIWVWSPHIAHEFWELYYPGSEHVDWVATGVLNYGPIAQWADWWSFREIFGQKYPELARFGKPVMIAEFGSLAVGGDRSEWYRRALAELRAEHPAVKSLLFFNVRSDQTLSYQKIDWTMAGDSATVHAVREGVAAWTGRVSAGGLPR